MKKAMVVPVEGDITFVEFDESTEGDVLKQGIGGGWLQVVQVPVPALKHDVSLWIDEEGKRKNLPLNKRATAIAAIRFGGRDYIAGDTVITGGGIDADANCDGLNPKEILTILTLVKGIRT